MPANTTASSPKKKKGRRARLLVIVLVLTLVAGVGYATYWSISTVRASFPQTTGTIKVDGLSGTVEVRRDSYGIPQIYADSDEDLFRAQGFVQAQDRFWEMDVRRHMTAGRLSEMFGSGQVDTDAFLRTLGWRQVAQQEYDTLLTPETKKYLQAYAAGVNSYLKGREGKELSVEYAALSFTNDYKPEPWTPVDSVAWLKAMAWDLRGNMQDEIDRSLLTSRLTEKQIKELYPSYPYDRNKPIVDAGGIDPVTGKFDPDAKPSDLSDGSGSSSGSGGNSPAGAAQGLNSQLAALSRTLDTIPALLGPSGSGIGSNSWVVSGTYTTTGKPMLANDPHLAPSLPSLWYQMGLHCRKVTASCQYDTAGYTFSGMPGVIIGHNQDIAWGFTNLGADVTDLYLEKLSGNSYQVGDEEKELKTRTEVIKVAGGSDKTIKVRSTGHGPLVSDRSTELEKVGEKAPVSTAPDRGAGYAVALQWTALRPGKSMDAVFGLNRAKDFKTFRAAAKNFEVPSQNLIYADSKGHIGYQAPGTIPVRAEGDGTTPAPGWDPKYKWKGTIPFDELPYEYDPGRGYIVTANQSVIDAKKYPYLLTKDYGYGARSQRINDLIELKIQGGGKVSTEDMRTMQMDNSSEIAKLLTPYLLKIDISDPYVREAQKLLEGWDYTQEPDSGAAAYFNGVWRNVLKLSFGNKLPKELRVEGECLNVRPADSSAPDDELSERVRECGERDTESAQPDGSDRWYEVVGNIIKDEDNAWWRSPASRTEPATTTRDQLLARAMDDARWELTAKLGKDASSWSWGRLHRLTLKNQTLGTEGPGFLQFVLNRGPWNLGGGEAAVNATGWNAAGGYGVIWVPSMRMVVNVGDWDKSRWISLTGASGHAYSAHYIDQTDKWANGELLDWAYSDQAVKAKTTDTLKLTP
ncbi:penicillin acylase family protein [Streptomyces lunaelactis]|uniref:penicillin acylase family protein n=1 Tax=Streptomyces lunaelactis TaxID=1535768 RepID=UPI00158573D8|nr:penicillin acylase family protein [Streptomyces lunaelactis]NUK02124.1 penicillin acylase family protein [Streptomyces lunaelactis]NUK20167.1 penicillin acylase family protein [Streptomyces lunaelactis]NUK35024.1 penicillin acylase family protein [Streptomyces lunaelactis]NUK45722.1 penicillin acylase family protein [Streptomyces lunaelactis]NUK96422.1 penicillin acylase family protein [Streptomyces lunaelactis]